MEGSEERLEALEAFTEKLIPGRWREVRPPNPQELKGTHVLAMGLGEASAKVRSGPPMDDPEDYRLPAWAGVLPLHLAPGKPQPDSLVAEDAELSPALVEWVRTRGPSGNVKSETPTSE